MRAITHWVLTTFTNPAGILILAALDSTLFFWLPFGVDAATIVFSMRGGTPWWAVALLATAGSLAGAAITFWMGNKAGDAGLDRLAPARHLEAARRRIRKTTHSAALATLSVIPPPFPFTPIVLAAGALDVKGSSFFATLAACRFARFGAEAYPGAPIRAADAGLARVSDRRKRRARVPGRWLDADGVHNRPPGALAPTVEAASAGLAAHQF